jgi:hypothetical protein
MIYTYDEYVKKIELIVLKYIASDVFTIILKYLNLFSIQSTINEMIDSGSCDSTNLIVTKKNKECVFIEYCVNGPYDISNRTISFCQPYERLSNSRTHTKQSLMKYNDSSLHLQTIWKKSSIVLDFTIKKCKLYDEKIYIFPNNKQSTMVYLDLSEIMLISNISRHFTIDTKHTRPFPKLVTGTNKKHVIVEIHDICINKYIIIIEVHDEKNIHIFDKKQIFVKRIEFTENIDKVESFNNILYVISKKMIWLYNEDNLECIFKLDFDYIHNNDFTKETSAGYFLDVFCMDNKIFIVRDCLRLTIMDESLILSDQRKNIGENFKNDFDKKLKSSTYHKYMLYNDERQFRRHLPVRDYDRVCDYGIYCSFSHIVFVWNNQYYYRRMCD